MGTMQAQPGTPMALENSLRSDDPMQNCSIIQAIAHQNYLEKLGLGFEKLSVTNPGTKDEMTLPQVQAMGINQGAPLKITGVSGKTVITIAQEILAIAGLDGVSSFLKIFLARNPKSTESDAHAALMKLDAVRGPVIASLNLIKRESGVL